MKALLDQVCRIALEAGQAIMEVYGREFSQQEKDDNSPLTEADLAAHKIIVNGLNKISDLPILSEEGALPEWEVRRAWQEYWIIDPLDGTKEFIKRNGEFTINIALINQGFPVLGVVYAPAIDILYYGVKGGGAFKLEQASNQSLKSATSIKSHSLKPSRWQVVGSRSHSSKLMDSFVSELGAHDMLPMGSSLKICAVADGTANIYPRLGPTSEWDTAAAHAIVLEADGVIAKTNGESLLYNTKNSILNPNFVVVNKNLLTDLPLEK